VNEEEIKIKYVLPWLEQAGVDVSDLQFEKTFSVRIGRQVIQTSEIRETATGRLDILVRRGERNLCIVETKAGNLALTDADRDQAISYARLVHPVAPYAIVTNGSEYRLYDSLSKTRVEPSTIRIQGFEIVLPDADLIEAQKIFLNLNPANLAAFCQRQVNGELQLVKGSVSDGRKYVSELHVPRATIQQEIEKFYKGPMPGLVLVGESGLGKTCEICSIVDSLLMSGKPVLFFNGFSLEGDVLSAIANEFSWVFNGGDLSIQVVKRLETCVGQTYLTIVIDAIDEWRFEEKINHFASLLKAVEHRKIKLLVSCKGSAIEPFLTQRGNQTATKSLTVRVDVPTFSPAEFFEAVKKYRQAYKFSGGFEDAVLDQARKNPYLLRVLFDVAQGSSSQHLTFSSADFFSEYYKRSVEKTADAHQAGNTLKGVARLLYQANQEWIAEDDLRNALGLTVNERIMDELFEFGMLVRSSDSTEESAISFYFQQFRDYIISFKVLHFNKMEDSLLMSELDMANFPSVRGAVFVLYYRLAPLEQKIKFDAKLRERASRYLKSYISLIDENFPLLKHTFAPRTAGRVGFIGEFFLKDRRIGMHGFRSLSEGDEEVHFIPVEQVGGGSNLPFLIGAQGLHLVGDGWGACDDSDIESAVRKDELLKQLLVFAAEGRLDESANPEMNSEHVVQLIFQNRDVFKSLLESDGRSIRYPVQLDSILECVRKEKLAREFHEDVVQSKLKSGQISEVWDGDFVSCSYSLNPNEEEAVARRVEEAMLRGEAPSGRVRYIELEELEARLLKALNSLRKSCSAINEPPPFIKGYDLVRNRTLVSERDLSKYLQGLYAAFLSNYRTLVERNFPTLAPHFELYSDQPVAVYLVIGAGFSSMRGYGSMSMEIYLARSKTGVESVSVVEQVNLCESHNGFRFTVDGVDHEGISWTKTTVAGAIAGFPTQAHQPFEGMILRGLVYSTIKNELPKVGAAFLAQQVVKNSTVFRHA